MWMEDVKIVNFMIEVRSRRGAGTRWQIPTQLCAPIQN
jgi:hypothetical protein